MANPASLGTDFTFCASASADRLVIGRASTSNWSLDYTSDGETFTSSTQSQSNISSAIDIANDATNFFATKIGNAAGSYVVRGNSFTWSTKSWGTAETIYSPVNVIGNFTSRIVRRSSDYVVLHEDDSEKVHGTNYSRVAVSYGSPGSWTKVSSGLNAGNASSCIAYALVVSNASRCHITYQAGATYNVRQFNTGNTWAGSDDTNSSAITSLTAPQYQGTWAPVTVSSNEYIVQGAIGGTSNSVAQAQSQASTSWVLRTASGASRYLASARMSATNTLRTFMQATTSGLLYRESTDGGVTWSSSDQTFASTATLGHTPASSTFIRAVGWTINGINTWSVVYLGPSSTYYHYYVKFLRTVGVTEPLSAILHNYPESSAALFQNDEGWVQSWTNDDNAAVITHIELQFRRVSGKYGDMIAKAYTATLDGGDYVPDTLLGTGSTRRINSVGTASFETLTFYFNPPIRVNPNEKYCFGFICSTSDVSDVGEVGRKSNAGNPGNAATTTDGGSSWAVQASYDLGIKLYGSVPTTSESYSVVVTSGGPTTYDRSGTDYLFMLTREARNRDHLLRDTMFLNSLRSSVHEHAQRTFLFLLDTVAAEIEKAPIARAATDYLFVNALRTSVKEHVQREGMLLATRRSNDIARYFFDKILARDVTYRGIDRSEVAKLFLLDTLTAEVGRNVSASDALFLLDARTSELAKTVLDLLFLFDTVDAAKETASIIRTITDSLFLLDFRSSELESLQKDAVLVNDAAQREIELMQRDALLARSTIAELMRELRALDNALLASIVARETESIRAAFDTLFVNDARTSELARALTDRMFVSDSAVTLKLTERQALDRLFLADSVIRAVEKLALDNILLDDSVTRVAEIVRSALDAVLLLDSVQISTPITNITVTDYLLLNDKRFSDLLRTLRDNLLVIDSRTSALERTHRDEMLMSDVSYRERALAFIDRLFLSDSADIAAAGSRAVTVVDGLLLDDARTAIDLAKLIRDAALLADTTATQRIAAQRILDNLLLADNVATGRDLLRDLIDYLLLGDSADTQITLSQQVYDRAALDLLFVNDSVMRAKEFGRVIFDAAFLLDSAALQREVDFSAFDSLLLRDDTVRDRLIALIDKLFIDDNAIVAAAGSRAVLAVDGLLMDDRQASLDIGKLIVDALLLQDLSREARALTVQAFDTLLLYDIERVGLVLGRLLLDALLVSDSSQRDTARYLLEQVLVASTGERAREALREIIDQIMLGDRRLASDLARVLRDGVTLNDAVIKLLEQNHYDTALLDSAAMIGKGIARELADAMLLLDRRASERSITKFDVLILHALANRAREILAREGVLLNDTGAGQWYPILIEILTYVRLGVSTILGLKTRSVDLLGRRFVALPLFTGSQFRWTRTRFP